MTAPDTRPTVVEVGTALLLIGAALLIAGGLQNATFSFDALRRIAPSSVSDASVRSYLTQYRATGALFIGAGIGLALLTGRTRRCDARARRAAMGLALATVLVWGAVAVFHLGYSMLILLSLVPTIAGVLLLSSRRSVKWFFPDYPLSDDD